jgi:GT2 family glycosyltransferase
MRPDGKADVTQIDTAFTRTYVVLLNWNGAEDTLQCLVSLFRLQAAEVVFVVCDNDSKSEDFGRLQSGLVALGQAHSVTVHQFPPGALVAVGTTNRDIVLLSTGANLGFAGGVNVGLRFALNQGDMASAWVLNNDSEVDAAALSALRTRMAQDPRIGICGSSLIYHVNRQMVQALGGARYQPWRGRSLSIGAFSAADAIPSDHTGVEQQMDYVVGASMLVSRRFLDVVGPMDERYFLYSEEHDWAHRGRQAGFTLGWASGSLVFHKHGATIGSSASGGSPLSMFYLYRNKAFFTAQHYPLRLPIALCWLLFDALKFIVKGHPAKTKAALRGLLAFPRLGRF